MRIIFYSFIILIAILVVVIFDQIVYWSSRVITNKETAQMVRCCLTGLLLVVLIVSALWGHYVTRFKIDITQTEVVSEKLPAAFNGYKVVQISDLHLDWFESERGHRFVEEMVDSILSVKPDLIVFTGDIVTIHSHEADSFIPSLKRLASAGIPVYSILGNHDYADYTRFETEQKKKDVLRLCNLQENAGWHMLCNQGVWIEKDSARIALLGVENIGEPPFSIYGNLPAAFSHLRFSQQDSIGTEPDWEHLMRETFKILLSHNPTHWRSEVIPDTDIDLMLAGHTHAVQIKIGNWSPAKWKYPEWGGLYSEGEQKLYVNTGIGGVGIPVRIGVPPEITVLTLRKKK
ncbi:MAG: metallophosphoesterase [Bacteroidales bacterium]|nr:metallophosphoesterase [Bacteroidales bacterium]